MIITSTPASLWDGSKQLTGILELWDNRVNFRLTDFHNSHLHLCIPLNNIEIIEEFLIFDLARNGLKIQDKDGKIDLFVINEVRSFKAQLIKTTNAFVNQ
jgi:hypothetical protein